jgi:hypothetical protein
MWCDLSIDNILPSRTRSGKVVEPLKVRATHAFRIAEFVLVKYSTGVLRVLSEKNVKGVEHLPRFRLKSAKEEYDLIQKIWDGRVTVEDINWR